MQPGVNTRKHKTYVTSNKLCFCDQFLQTEGAISEAVSDLCSRLRNEHNVRYAEIRFCPALHTTKGLSEENVVEAAIRGY